MDLAKLTWERDQLTTLLKHRDEVRAEQLAGRVLEQSRIDQFTESVAAEVTRGRETLVSLFPSRNVHSLDGGIGLNLNSAVSKEFFVATSDVHADPHELGREVGAAIAWGEQDQVIERLRSIATPDTPHAEDELPSIQKALAAAGEPDRVVVITNSWRAAHAVATRREHTGDDSGDSYVTERGVPVVHIVSDQSSFAVLIDPRASVQVLRGTVRPERAGEKFDDDLHLLLGVSELTDTERAELTKPERDARTLVRIRVVDRFDVEAIDNPRVVWCATGDN